MRITLDTNVLYQALRSRTGASHYIFRLVRIRRIELALSIPIYFEYREVLLRRDSLQDLNLTVQDIEAVLRFLAYIGKPHMIHFVMRPNLRDEADNMFVDLAFSSNSRFLITRNVRDFIRNAALRFDSSKIVTPDAFVRRWRQDHEERI